MSPYQFTSHFYDPPATAELVLTEIVRTLEVRCTCLPWLVINTCNTKEQAEEIWSEHNKKAHGEGSAPTSGSESSVSA